MMTLPKMILFVSGIYNLRRDNRGEKRGSPLSHLGRGHFEHDRGHLDRGHLDSGYLGITLVEVTLTLIGVTLEGTP